VTKPYKLLLDFHADVWRVQVKGLTNSEIRNTLDLNWTNVDGNISRVWLKVEFK